MTHPAQIRKQVDALLRQAELIIVKEVERRARKILAGKNAAVKFTMCMGHAFFTNKHGEPINSDDHECKYLDSFYDFLSEYDDRLHITGWPMMIDGPDAPTRTDW